MPHAREPFRIPASLAPQAARLRPEPPLARSSNLARAAFVVVCLWGIVQAAPFLIPLSIAAVLAFMMAPLSRRMKKAKLPEWLTIALSAILLILPVAAILSLLAWQVQSLIHDFPKWVGAFNGFLTDASQSAWAEKVHLDKVLHPDAFTQRLAERTGEGIHLVLAGLLAILGAGSQLALILLFAVLMISSREHLWRSGVRMLSRGLASLGQERHSRRLEAVRVLAEIVGLIERFLVARFLIILIISGIDSAILIGFHLPYAILMSTLLGVMTLIPAIGFLIGVTPPVLVMLIAHRDPLAALLLFGVLLAVSAFEGNVLTPKLVGRRLNINTLSTFIGFFAGGLLWGPWGMFLSIPVMGVLRVIFSTDPDLQSWSDLIADKPRAGSAATEPYIGPRS